MPLLPNLQVKYVQVFTRGLPAPDESQEKEEEEEAGTGFVLSLVHKGTGSRVGRAIQGDTASYSALIRLSIFLPSFITFTSLVLVFLLAVLLHFELLLLFVVDKSGLE